MRLQPLTDAAQPTYPSRHRVFAAIGAWARRVGGATLAAGALLCGACYGMTPLDPGGGDPSVPETISAAPPGPFQPYVGMGGEVMAPSFQCSATRPYPRDTVDSWGYWEGPLCGEESGWAWYDVPEEGLYQISIGSNAEWVSLVVLVGDAEVTALDGDRPSVELGLSPARHTLVATAVDPVGHPSDWFAVTFVRVGD